MAIARRRRRAWALAGLVGLMLLGAVALQRRTANNDILRTVTLGWQPYSIALDTRTERAFVMGVSRSVTTGFSGRLAVLDTSSGAFLRTVTLGPNPTDMVVDARAGRVFVTDIVEGTVRVFDARTGVPVRTVGVGEMEPHDVQRIVIDEATGRVFVSTTPVGVPDPSASAVHILDARSGALLGIVKAGGGSLAVDEQTGRVFAIDANGDRLSLLDAHSGAVLHTVTAGSGALYMAMSARTGHVFVAGDMGVTMLDGTSGRVLRALPGNGALFLSLATDEAPGRVFVVTGSSTAPYNGSLRAIDTRTGAIVRATAIQDPNDMVIDTRRGRVFVTLGNGVGVFDARSGALSRTVATGAHPSVAAIDERSGRVFVVDRGTMDANGNLTRPGSVSVLDAHNGALIRAITVGVYPGPMAVDERTGHVFVVDDGGPVRLSDPWGWVPSWLRRRLPLLPPPPSATRTVPGSVMMLDATR